MRGRYDNLPHHHHLQVNLVMHHKLKKLQDQVEPKTGLITNE